MAVDNSDSNWQQAQLCQWFGGRGCVKCLMGVVFIPLLWTLLLHLSLLWLLQVCVVQTTSTCSRFNTQVPPHESITVEACSSLPPPPPPPPLCRELYLRGWIKNVFQSLLSSSSPVNKAQILSVFAPHGGSWIYVIHFTSFDLLLSAR